MSDALRPHGLYSPWNSSVQNTGVGSLSLLQRIFPTQGSNPGLLHCRQILYQLSHQVSPRKLEWVAYPFSGGSSRPRNRTDGFFANWAPREAQWGSINFKGKCWILMLSFVWCILFCKLETSEKDDSFKKIILFIYLLSMLSLCCCTGFSLVVVNTRLIVVASLIVEQGLLG